MRRSQPVLLNRFSSVVAIFIIATTVLHASSEYDCELDASPSTGLEAVRLGRCQISVARVDGLNQKCYTDSRLFSYVAIQHGETPFEGVFSGALSTLADPWYCDGCGEVQVTASVVVDIEDGRALLTVTPDEGKVLYSFGVHFEEYEFFPEEVGRLRGWFKSYPGGRKGPVDISYGSSCNDNLKIFNYWTITAVICDEGDSGAVAPPVSPPPAREFYCRESWGRVCDVDSKCFIDTTLFPTVGWSNGRLLADGNYTGVMETFSTDENCEGAEETGTLAINVECGKAEVLVTPAEGKKLYSISFFAAVHDLTSDQLMRYNSRFTSIPDGSRNTHRLAYGTCTAGEYTDFMNWSVYAIICDEGTSLPPAMTVINPGSRR